MLSFLLQNKTYSQQGKSDATFNVYDDGLQGDGFDNTVRTVSVQSDSKVIVGGDYLNFNGTATPYLCRLFQDGSKDTSFNLGTSFNGKVYCSLLQPDGKILLGGAFTSFNGVAANRLIRLNNDGSIDATFNTQIAASSGIVYSLALQSNGSIIVAGSFTKYNGVTANRVVRLLPSGTVDTDFVIGLGASGVVEEVQIQPDGKIILSGSFDFFNGISNSKIIRLNADGSPDPSFTTGLGFNATVSALAIQPDGKIIAGGDFVSYNGNTANKIIRLNTDGSIDGTFVSGLGFSSGVVEVIKLNAIGFIAVGGSFTGTYNGVDVNRMIVLNPLGIMDPLFDIGAGPFSASVLDLAIAGDSSWYIAGSFSVFDSQNQGRLAKVDPFGALDIAFLTAGVGFDNSVLKVLALSDNKTMAFGNFTKFNGVLCNRIARLADDGSIDSTFNSGGIGANNTVRSALLQPDNKVVIAGTFTSYNGLLANRIARVLSTGMLDPSFITGIGANNIIYALALQPDGKIIIAGNFTSYNGIVVNRITRLLPDGSIDLTFNTGLGADAIVEAIVLQPDGKIVLGGRFTTFNTYSFNRIVRLNSDGSIDSSFSVGSGFDKNVYALAFQSDNKLIVGGAFLTYKGLSAKRILRLNGDGSLDVTFNSGAGLSSGDVRCILVQPDDRMLVGGTFSGTFNGIAVKRMLRLLSSGVYDTTFLVNLNGSLYSACFTVNHKVIIGGSFNSVSGITKHRVARIKLCTNSSTWNGIAWDNGLPSEERTLIFNASYTPISTINACSCSIISGNTVTVANGNTLGLVFDYSGAGTLILENNAALYQSEDQVINTGIILLKRKTTPILKMDYTYWSTPVINQKLIDVSPNTRLDKFYSFNAGLDSWLNEDANAVMTLGKGYIIRGPESFSDSGTAIHEAVFTGVPNNGLVTLPIGASGTSNLVGNPYPSALDANLFLIENSANVDGTIYLWTHNTAITNNLYTSDDYATYNLLGGVGTNPALSSGVSTSKPDGNIASGQSFFVTSINNTGDLKFNNSMRLNGQNSTFYRFNGDKKAKQNEVEKHRIWLNLFNNQGAFKQILVGYANRATHGLDASFDGESFNGNQYLDFYSIVEDKYLAIQGRALPFAATDEIKLGYSTTIAGSFTIKIDQRDAFFSGQNVFIEDKFNNTSVNLKNENFTFTTAVGVFNERFVLRFTDKTLALNDLVKDNESVVVFRKNEQLIIHSNKENIYSIAIHDLAGRKMFAKNNINEMDFLVSTVKAKNQVVLVIILLQNGLSIVQKVIY